MRIDFFTKSGALDSRSVYGGIYRVKLRNDRKKESLLLYIGKSLCILRRGNEHLSVCLKDPGYFGLTKEDLDRDDLTLEFEVAKAEKYISGLNWRVRSSHLVAQEKELIQEEKPLTQRDTSDRQLSQIERMTKVQKAIRENFGIPHF